MANAIPADGEVAKYLQSLLVKFPLFDWKKLVTEDTWKVVVNQLDIS